MFAVAVFVEGDLSSLRLNLRSLMDYGEKLVHGKSLVAWVQLLSEQVLSPSEDR